MTVPSTGLLSALTPGVADKIKLGYSTGYEQEQKSSCAEASPQGEKTRGEAESRVADQKEVAPCCGDIRDRGQTAGLFAHRQAGNRKDQSCQAGGGRL